MSLRLRLVSMTMTSELWRTDPLVVTPALQ